MDLDTEKIITEVQSRANLWNAADDYYRDRDLKMETWEDVTKKVVATYDTMSKADQKKALANVQKRWKSVKDAKMRSMAAKKKFKPQPGKKFFKRYKYDKQLQFLESLTQSNTTESKKNQKSENEEVDPGFNDKDVKEEVNVTSDRDLLAAKIKSPSEEKQQKNHFKEELLPAIRETTIEDEDRSFFESLLPTVRPLDPDQKLIFRSRVLSLLVEIKNSSRPTSNHSSMYQTSSINHNNPYHFSHQPYSHYSPISTPIQCPTTLITSPGPSYPQIQTSSTFIPKKSPESTRPTNT